VTADTRQQERDRTRREALAQARKRLSAEIRNLNTLLRDHADHLDRVEIISLFELADHIAAYVTGPHDAGRCTANRDRAREGTL
jgi:hypothetical protein